MVGIPVLYWGGDVEDLEEMKVHGTFFEIDYVFNVFYIDAYVDLYTLFKKNANTLLVNDKDQDKEILENIDSYSLEDIESKLSVYCVRNKISFTKDGENPEQDPLTYNLGSLNDQDESVPAWIKAALEKQKNM